MEAGSDIFSSEGVQQDLVSCYIRVFGYLNFLSSRGPTPVFSNQSGPVLVETVGNRGYISDGGRHSGAFLFFISVNSDEE
jgi:hypothetical protein